MSLTRIRDRQNASTSGDEDSRENNAAAIAAALGLTQTPSTDYRRLGGPGFMSRRSGRTSESSSEGRSLYSRGSSQASRSQSSGTSSGILDKQMKSLAEDAGTAALDDQARRPGLTKSKSTGKERTFTENEDVTKAKIPERSNTVQVVQSAESRPNSPKISTWTRTSSEGSMSSGSRMENKPRVCLRCHVKIDGRRWVQVEAGILCDSCWKNMYLPKCRRCNLPIEKQAVSSSDGQLKGKYHRECFNCHTCHKPFPDKSFYVYDGKPLCAYHYHEANDSLCAASSCGQPIEGPCAVSHTGERYHPEHMTCEYPGDSPCKEYLKEYWEVDGRMLCERHAHASAVGSDEEGEGEQKWVQSAKARKRVTRFIDLAAKPDNNE